MVQLSHPYMTTRKSIQAFVSTVMSLLNMLSRFVIAFIEISRACSVVSDSLQSHGLYPTRLFCPWNSLQEYWSVLPFPTPEGLPIPETEPMSPAPRSKQLLTSWLCSARSPNPQSGKKTPQDNATCNRGIYYWLEPGPPALTKGVRMKRPRAPVLLGIYWVQSGSWHKRIGYTVARQFLLAQSLWAFSFPLIGSLFLARHMLIGWLQVAW